MAILIKDVLAAYEKHGFKACSNRFSRPGKRRCPLAILFKETKPGMVFREAAEKYGLEFASGFIHGFDSCSRESGREPDYYRGYKKGQQVLKAVVKAGLLG